MSAKGRIRIGTSGWHYRHWVGPFYPAGTRPAAFLGLYAREFATVEVNNTFYRLPSEAALAAWRDAVPPGFVFACKASRYITHMKKLKDPEVATRAFFAAIETLGQTAGPILFQLPPRWSADPGRLESFLAVLPAGRRYAFEFRDESWLAEPVFELLARHDAALCAYDIAGRQSPVVETAGFAYVRLHGPGEAYRGSYDDAALAGWARRIADWAAHGRDVYCYFDNDEAGYAPRDAGRLIALLEGGSGDG